jgi:DNA-binding response OmpR family regulator
MTWLPDYLVSALMYLDGLINRLCLPFQPALGIDSGSFRALLTDINLDGEMDGWKVAQHSREIEPEFPVVYMSAAAAADWTYKGVPNSIMLAKPFAPAQLLTAVSNLLNSGAPTA